MAAPPINLDYYPANWHSPRDGATPLAIIVHDTESPNGDSRKYLKRGGARSDGSDRKVSIHVLIRNGIIYRMVDDDQAANHAGGVLLANGTLSSRLTVGGITYRGAQVNRRSLGMELEHIPGGPMYSDADLLAMGWQINAWRARFGPIPVTRHATIDPGRRSDPVGLTVAAIELWVARAAAAAQPKHFRVKAKSGANVRQGRSTSTKVLTVLGPGDAWAGYVTPGERVSVAGFGASNEWICDAAGRCVWRGLLDEVNE